MNEPYKFKGDDKMAHLISNNYSLLMVMSRFGLSLGFGDKTVKETCQKKGIDYKTFLAVANFINDNQLSYEEDRHFDFSVAELMVYLRNAHDFFLNFQFPTIRQKLIAAIDFSDKNNMGILILKFYDEYVKEVKKHMDYEDKAVFVYVDELLKGNLSDKYNIQYYATKHNQTDKKLNELKNIIIKYYPEKSNNNLMNSVLFDIYNCEQDLASHGLVEDYMFVPAVANIEKKLKHVAQ